MAPTQDRPTRALGLPTIPGISWTLCTTVIPYCNTTYVSVHHNIDVAYCSKKVQQTWIAALVVMVGNELYATPNDNEVFSKFNLNIHDQNLAAESLETLISVGFRHTARNAANVDGAHVRLCLDLHYALSVARVTELPLPWLAGQIGFKAHEGEVLAIETNELSVQLTTTCDVHGQLHVAANVKFMTAEGAHQLQRVHAAARTGLNLLAACVPYSPHRTRAPTRVLHYNVKNHGAV